MTPLDIRGASQIKTTQLGKNFVNLYTCYPKPFKLDSGPLGDFHAPACPPDKLYAKFKVHEVHQPAYLGKNNFDEMSGMATYHYETVTESAENIAADFVDRHGAEFGVFRSDSDGEPSKDCVEAARWRMVRKMADIVAKAESDWEAHHDRLRITDRAREAARYIGADVKWIDPAVGVKLADVVTSTQAQTQATAATRQQARA